MPVPMNEEEKQELERLRRRMRAVINELMTMKTLDRYRDILKGLPILGAFQRMEQTIDAAFKGLLSFKVTIEGLVKPQLEVAEELLQALKEKSE